MAVRYAEGLVHGFLVLRSLDGRILANGDLKQVARNDRVTTKLEFRFRDGSYQGETAVFSQRRYFRLLTSHLIQKGPSFPHPMEVSIDRGTGLVTVRYKDDDGKEIVANERIDLPADLANSLVPILLKNLSQETTTLSMLAFTPKPQLVKLVVSRSGKDSFAVGRGYYKSSHFVLKVEIGGLRGLLAPVFGKQPLDNHVWILGGEAPAFVRSEAPLYVGGPSWRIELTSPTFSPAAFTGQR